MIYGLLRQYYMYSCSVFFIVPITESGVSRPSFYLIGQFAMIKLNDKIEKKILRLNGHNDFLVMIIFIVASLSKTTKIPNK